MTEQTKTWLDVMPAIPLDRAVPVRWRDALGRDHDGIMMSDQILWTGEEMVEPDTHDHVRADLGDPQGLSYALRWWARTVPREYEDELPDWWWRLVDHMAGDGVDTIDLDEVAQACAEVTS